MSTPPKLRVWSVEYWLRHARRAVVMVVGGTVLLIGVIMIVTPGPAVIVVPAGLAILATEFAWARRWLRKAKEFVSKQTSEKAAPPKLGSGGTK